MKLSNELEAAIDAAKQARVLLSDYYNKKGIVISNGILHKELTQKLSPLTYVFK